jgi:transposase
MHEIRCKRCGSTEYVRNGMARGLQRYRCEACGCNFTMTPPRGKPPEMKALALLLYAMGNLSFRGIARLLRVSNVTVLTWVRDAAHRLPEPSVPDGTVIVTFDEMWHFLEKKLESFGFGALTIPLPAAPSPGYWVAVTTRPSGDSSTRPGSRAGPSSPTIGRGTTGSFPRTNSSRART